MSGMDFFDRQDAARRSTRLLIALFGLAVAAIIACIHFAAVLAATLATGEKPPQGPVLAIVAVATIAVVGIAMAVRIASLGRGGSAVAQMLGGRPVAAEPDDPKERMLRNLVEEMALASGVPVPKVYVLDDERGINAFAAGWTTDDAAVAVTRGCLDALSRDELQGVIAHEFSHVVHGDMRLNIRLIGVIAGIVCLATIGRVLLRVRGRSSSGGKGKDGAAAIAVFGLALVAIGWIGVFFARLLQAAVSRQREFLADASGVQFTRNPRGLALALARIGGAGSRIRSPHAQEASHMFFADGIVRAFGGAFASHPPLRVRIERILPGFTRNLATAGSAEAAAAATPLPPELAGMAPARRDVGVRRTRPGEMVAAVGTVQPADVDAARELLASLPLEVATAAHEPTRVGALLAALLVDRTDAAATAAQDRALARLGPAGAHDARALHLLLRTLPPTARLPLVELAAPALRGLPPAEQTTLRAALAELAAADGGLSLFEWTLLRLADRLLGADAAPARGRARPVPLAARAEAAARVLSVLARLGPGDAATAAFARGARELGGLPNLRLAPPAADALAALGRAVDDLADVSALGKRNLLAACAEAAAHDGVLADAEVELLRALAAVWDCPMPLTLHG